jgi:hypothetical protein
MDSHEPWWVGLFVSVGGWMILASVVLPVLVGIALIVIRASRRRDQE